MPASFKACEMDTSSASQSLLGIVVADGALFLDCLQRAGIRNGGVAKCTITYHVLLIPVRFAYYETTTDITIITSKWADPAI